MSPKMVAIPITITVEPELIQTIGAIRDELWRALQSLDEMRVKHDHFYGRVRDLHEHLKEMFEPATVNAARTVWADNPQATQINQAIERATRLTNGEMNSLAAARNAARAATRLTNGEMNSLAAARAAARAAAWDAAWAAGNAVDALVVRDLIDESTSWNQKAYDLLTGPWRRVIGPIHPADEVLS